MTAVEGERAVGPPIDDDAGAPPPEAGPLVPEARSSHDPEPTEDDTAPDPAEGAEPTTDDAAAADPASPPADDVSPSADTAAAADSDPAPDDDEVPPASPDGGAASGGDDVAHAADGEVTSDPADDAARPEVAPGGEPAPPAADAPPPAVPPPPPPAGPAAPRRRLRLLAAVLAAGLLALGGGIVGALAALSLRPPPASAPAPTGLVAAVAAVAPAVLRIQAGDPDTGTAGTALIVTPTGDVVTNAHLVVGETTATLIFPDGHSSPARVLKVDEAADLAWLRIDGAQGLPVVRLAGPDAVQVGEDVVAIGNALNLDGAPSITRGIVSAVGRSTATLTDVIQTDAAISSGSSGGALVDRSGTVVGITTEALVGDPSVSVEDIAFAIPADRVVTVLRGMGLVLPG